MKERSVPVVRYQVPASARRHLEMRVKRNQHHDQQHALGATTFNSGIFKWDVSGTTNMTGMFRGVTVFKKRQRHIYVGRVKCNRHEPHVPRRDSF